jgi:hypothetical protein
MNIIGKLLVVLIIAAGGALLYLAAGVLAAEKNWHLRVREFEQAIVQTEQSNQVLAHGGPLAKEKRYKLENGIPPADTQGEQDKLGVDQYRLLIDMLVVDRGRVWAATRGQVTPTGEVSVSIDKPDPHEIKDKAILYAFEKKSVEEGGTYLGQFKVTGISGKTLALAPVDRLLAPEVQSLEQSQAPWLLCEVMPTDRSWIFAGLTEEQIGKMLPESARADYLRNGKAATDTDDPDSVSEAGGEKKFVRPLRDYAAAFLGLRKHVAELLDDLVAAKVDLDQMNKAVKAAESQVTLRDTEIASLKTELETSSKERDLVKTQQTALAARVAALQAEATQLMDENKKLAAQWTAKQLEAAKKMEQLSRVPQTGGVQ